MSFESWQSSFGSNQEAKGTSQHDAATTMLHHGIFRVILDYARHCKQGCGVLVSFTSLSWWLMAHFWLWAMLGMGAAVSPKPALLVPAGNHKQYHYWPHHFNRTPSGKLKIQECLLDVNEEREREIWWWSFTFTPSSTALMMLVTFATVSFSSRSTPSSITWSDQRMRFARLWYTRLRQDDTEELHKDEPKVIPQEAGPNRARVIISSNKKQKQINHMQVWNSWPRSRQHVVYSWRGWIWHIPEPLIWEKCICQNLCPARREVDLDIFHFTKI